ncbi:Nucleotide-binding universal stress protein, UspA family [Asanoa hainanensis]|uniref:Nucleotide-binding universal stress protein, UspA family n=1 Tax=Asanoa hainanensis TaxID=560556 RepID=A0A239P129_9ACTN|nr:universal stress protein [Asanoa hainanensis]SNT60795.1 Nucleotide-binding universal stress protein, UspA family [Asanoa hainanensis]
MDRETILVGYDGSAGARTAVAWALEEARRWSCRVRLVDVFEWPVRVGPATTRPQSWPRTEAYRGAERTIQRTVTALADANPDVPVDGLVVEGPPAAMLADLSSGVRLVVVGSGGSGGFRGRPGSTTRHLLRHALCPVLVVPEPTNSVPSEESEARRGSASIGS